MIERETAAPVDEIACPEPRDSSNRFSDPLCARCRANPRQARRAPRGRAPLYCAACAPRVKSMQRLKGYLRAATAIAEALGNVDLRAAVDDAGAEVEVTR